jgi:hypothetical protein
MKRSLFKVFGLTLVFGLIVILSSCSNAPGAGSGSSSSSGANFSAGSSSSSSSASPTWQTIFFDDFSRANVFDGNNYLTNPSPDYASIMICYYRYIL